MQISNYQADNVIKAYNRQSKARFRLVDEQNPLSDNYADVVKLSDSDFLKVDAKTKISGSLMAVLLGKKKIVP